ADRDRVAKRVICCSITDSEFLLQAPARSAAHKYVCCAWNLGIWRTDHNCFSANRDRVAKRVIRRAIIGDELLLLAPTGPIAHKDVSSALILIRSNVSARSPDHGRIPADRDLV